MNPHPLTQYRRISADSPEQGTVLLADLHQIDRARCAIGAIARIAGNNADEPAATGATPLDSWTVMCLLDGVESLCDYMGLLVEEMLGKAEMALEPDSPEIAFYPSSRELH